MNGYQEFYDFMQEYTTFFQNAAATEEEKLRALLSDDLHRIERALTVHQRLIKQVEQYEKQRAALQERLGLQGKTFKEIISMEDVSHQQELKSLFSSFDAAIRNIKHSNSRSLDIARLNLQILEELQPAGVTDSHCYTQSGTVEHNSKSSGMLHKQA